MTLEEARREINKANSKLFRLYQSEFKKGTPASKVLEKNLKKLGLGLTEKGYISTKGANFQKIIGAGRQAQIFRSSMTSTPSGSRQDIANRLGTWEKKIKVTPEQAKAVWKIFNRKFYKQAKELIGSDGLIFLATRFVQNEREKKEADPRYREKSVGLFINRQAKAFLEGELTAEELLFGNVESVGLKEVSDEEVEKFLNSLENEDF